MPANTAPLRGPTLVRTGRLSRLAWQLPLASGVLIVLVASGIAGVSFRAMQRLSTNAADARLHYAVRELAALLAAGPRARLDTLRAAAADPAIAAVLAGRAGRRADALQVMTRVRKDNAQPDAVEVWDHQGRVILALAAPAESLAVPEALRRAPAPPAADTAAWISPIECRSGICAFSTVARVPGDRGPIGFLVRLRRLRPVPRATVSLLTNLIGSEARLIVGEPGRAWTDLSAEADGPTATQFSTRAGSLYRSPQRHEAYGLGERIPGTPWFVWVEFPFASVQAPAKQFLHTLVVAGFALVFLGVLVGAALSWRITRPLAELTTAAERLSAGDLSARATIRRRGELGLLADSFNRMADVIGESQRTLEARVRERTAALVAAAGQLHVSETRFRSLAASASDAIIIGDAQGTITFVNEAGEAMLGYGHGTLVGRPILDLVPPAHRAACQMGQERFTTTGVRHHAGQVMSLHALHRDGRLVPVDLSITGWDEDGARSVGAIVRDTTARTALDNALRERARELEDINAELAAFSYSVSHDLRAPLRGIRGFSQALIADHAAQLDAEGRDYLRRVDAAAARMGDLIDDLLELSRVSRTSLRRERVDLTPLADRLMAELRGRAPERDVEFIRPDHLMASGDARLLGLILQNLLDNAWKFTAGRARARIALGQTAAEAEPSYFVSDDGAGFDARYADKLFTVFQRLHSETEFPGTGVGLAIVQRIVHRHGGRVWAEGAVGVGATFHFTLGVASAAPGASEWTT